MTFENTRGIFSVTLDNGITVMSINDYAFMLRTDVSSMREQLRLYENDVVDFVFFNSNIDSDDDVLLGIQYHYADEVCANSYSTNYAIVGCRWDSYCEYDEMIEHLLNQ